MGKLSQLLLEKKAGSSFKRLRLLLENYSIRIPFESEKIDCEYVQRQCKDFLVKKQGNEYIAGVCKYIYISILIKCW